jgi:ADP-L-glycero-D-manno-heptose 6-epimerase
LASIFRSFEPERVAPGLKTVQICRVAPVPAERLEARGLPRLRQEGASMILVTGGAGFIGSNLVASLNDRGVTEIAVNDHLGSLAKERNLKNRRYSGIVSPGELFRWLDGRKLEAILHMGAISSTTATDEKEVMAANFELPMRLLDWCTATRTPFIYASSAATYGDGSAGFDDEFTLPALDRLQPLNLYGKSKHETDRDIRRRLNAGEKAPPHWAGLKFFNVYGPYETHKGEMRSIICKLHEQIVATGVARLFRSERPDYADGGQLRDFIWVGDCVDIMLWLLRSKKFSGLFNVGTSAPRSFVDVATATFAAMGRKPIIEFVDMPLSLRGKYQYYTRAEMQRLRAAGYDRPFTALEAGIERYVRDHLSRQDRK